MVRTKKIRGKVYKYGGKYSNRSTALSRAKAVRRQGNKNATVLKEGTLFIVWVRDTSPYY